MQQRVTAILVARNGVDFLERTLSSLAAQTRRPNTTILVDDASIDGSAAMLAAFDPTVLVTIPAVRSYGTAIARALDEAGPDRTDGRQGDDEWLWLLAHDNAPEPGALAALLAAVEIAPSVAVAGPKLMRSDASDVIDAYGETITRFGATVALVSGELDQAQHDRQSDMLAVSGNGMLVRRAVWQALGGFDPALPAVDAALDFCIRVRLAGHRIVGVPTSRVASAGGPELFDRRTISGHHRHTLHRRAELHRRLVYAPGPLVVLHWLLLVPLALVRSLGHLLGKHPGSIPGEFSAAFAAAFDRGVLPARRRLRATRKLGWGVIAPLRMPRAEVRELRAHQRAIRAAPIGGGAAEERIRPSFLSHGGAWIVIFLLAIGAVAFSPLLGAAALTGGGLAPLSATLGELWSNVGYGWREIGPGFIGAADPFAFILALLGTLTFWSPSLSIVAVYVVALPLAALGAWWCAARFSARGWAPATAAILWAFAPPLLTALDGGHLGAVIAHLLLPWLLLTIVNATRSWSAGAASSLLFAATIGCAPSLAPALVIGWIAWLAAHPRHVTRLIGVPIPAIVMFTPLVVDHAMRGTLLGLLADPGVPVVDGTSFGWQLALGSPVDGFNGWAELATTVGLHGLGAPIIVAALLSPLAALALLALFLPGSSRAVPAMAVAFVGFATAVAASHLHLVSIGEASPMVWPGAGLSLYWLGLLGAVVITLESLGRTVVVPALLVTVASVALAAPLLGATLAGTTAVQASTGRMLPAFVTAEAAEDPDLGTLEITAQPGGSISAVLHRGTGTTLDSRSTLAATTIEPDEAQRRVAVLAGNLVSQSGFDAATEMQELGIGFVVAPSATGEVAAETRKRAGEALDGNPLFTAIGDTSSGYLWRFGALEPGSVAERPGPLDTAMGLTVIGVQSLVLLVTVLLAVPTGSRKRQRTSTNNGPTEPASTFEEDDNA
jgi:GT2 family glycosyltransferase